MLGPDQAVQIHRPQLDLVALRLAQPRPPRRPLRTRLLRQILEKPIARHRCLPQWPLSKGITTPAHEQPKLAEIPKESQRSEEHTSELQSLMRISYAVICLTKK